MPLTTLFGLESAEATVVAALLAGVIALYLNYRKSRSEAVDRRRSLHGEAYQAVLEWCEGVWRVRRRPKDGSGDGDLVKHFHTLQEKIAYYEGWLALEDPELGRAFRDFLNAVMSECRPLIQEAWGKDGRHPSEPAPPGERNPELDGFKEIFLEDTRELGSRWPWVRHRARERLKGSRADGIDTGAGSATGPSTTTGSAKPMQKPGGTP